MVQGREDGQEQQDLRDNPEAVEVLPPEGVPELHNPEQENQVLAEDSAPEVPQEAPQDALLER